MTPHHVCDCAFRLMVLALHRMVMAVTALVSTVVMLTVMQCGCCLRCCT